MRMTLIASFLVASISAVYGWSMPEQSMPKHPQMNEICSTIQLSRRQSFKSLLAGGVLGTGVVAHRDTHSYTLRAGNLPLRGDFVLAKTKSYAILRDEGS